MSYVCRNKSETATKMYCEIEIYEKLGTVLVYELQKCVYDVH
jgi:hypothetical protein